MSQQKAANFILTFGINYCLSNMGYSGIRIECLYNTKQSHLSFNTNQTYMPAFFTLGRRSTVAQNQQGARILPAAVGAFEVFAVEPHSRNVHGVNIIFHSHSIPFN